MAFYDEQIIDQVQQATDIVAVIEHYVPLKRAGRNFKACCPFHKEKTPSFIVSPDRQTFHCFGCSVGGDVYEFLIKMDGMSFPETVQYLARLANIELPERTGSTRAQVSKREKLLSIYTMADRFFRAHFYHERAGRAARAYMAQREFDEAVLKEFGVGFAPQGFCTLFEALRKKEISEEDLLASGLASRTQKGHVIDLFRNRVMFPICNAQGSVIAFGGRVMDKSDPKYINSPESEVFKKRRELYALHLAKKFIDRDDPYLVIVEGYLDVMRLHSAGIRNVVGTLGTALTEEHARLLRRYAREVVIVFDGDQAGENASVRGLEEFLKEDLSVRLVGLPFGLDPDDFVRERGREAFLDLLKMSEDMFVYKIKWLMKKHNPKDIKGLLTITKEMVATLAQVPNAVLTDRYVKQLAGVLSVDEQAIRLELAKVRDKLSARVSAAKPEQEHRSTQQSHVPFHAEYAIISLIAEDHALAHQAFDLLSGDDFFSRETSEVFDRIQKSLAEGKSVPVRTILHWNLSETLKSFLTAAPFQHLSEDERRTALHDCVAHLRERARKEQLAALQKEIQKAEQLGDQEKLTALMRDFQALTRARLEAKK